MLGLWQSGSHALGATPNRRGDLVYVGHAAPVGVRTVGTDYTVAVVELDSSARLTGRVAASLEEVAIGDRVELQVQGPETVDIDPGFDLSYEAEWPIHVFELV